MLFNLLLFGGFPAIFLLLVYRLIPLCSQACFDFYSFKFVNMCFMPKNMVYLGDCSTWAWEKCAFFALFEVVYKCQEIPLIDSAVQLVQLYRLTAFPPAGSFHFWQRGDGASNFNSGLVYFSFRLYQIVAQIFWCSGLGSTTLKTVIFWWWIAPLFIMQCSSLSRIIFPALAQSRKPCTWPRQNLTLERLSIP